MGPWRAYGMEASGDSRNCSPRCGNLQWANKGRNEMSEQGYPASVRRFGGEAIHRIAGWLFVCLILLSAGALGERLTKPVALDFPDFPLGVAVIDLGQRLAIDVDARNDGGRGVTWS